MADVSERLYLDDAWKGSGGGGGHVSLPVALGLACGCSLRRGGVLAFGVAVSYIALQVCCWFSSQFLAWFQRGKRKR